MRVSLSDLILQKPLILADGATGTNFMGMGLPPGFPPDLWNVSAPDKPHTLHQAFVEAGADIILTNTFGANAPRLQLHQAQEQTYAINKAGAEIAAEVAVKASLPVVVAGSVGPTGELFVPMGSMTMDRAVAVFAEQMRGLRDGGVDVVWIETMSAVEEIEAAVKAAMSVDMPFCFTASFDTAGHTMMGLAPADLAGLVAKLPQKPLAYGANCGVGASDMLIANLAMSKADADGVIISKANCGVPVIKGKQTVYSGSPETMAAFVHLAARAGVRIVGGCCGTTPAHLLAMAGAVSSHMAGERPDEAEITDALGPLMAPVGQVTSRARRGRTRGKERG